MGSLKPFTGTTSDFMVRCQLIVEDGKIIGLEPNDDTAAYGVYEDTRYTQNRLVMQRVVTTPGNATMVMSGVPSVGTSK